MSMYKNSLTQSSKVLAAHLSCMVIALGLALPVYGQTTDTDPADCATITRSTSPTVPGVDPVAGRADDSTTTGASSFAAGCDADAQTSGSVAIGDGAVVESYLVTTPAVVEMDEVPARYAVRDSEGIVRGGVVGTLNAEGTTITLTEIHPIFGAVGVIVPIPARDGEVLGFSIETPGTPAVVGVLETTETRGANGIAVGNGSKVVGADSIAIGSGASVVSITPAVEAADAVPARYAVRDSEGIVRGGVVGTLNAEGTTITLTEIHPIFGAVGVIVPIPARNGEVLGVSIETPGTPEVVAMDAMDNPVTRAVAIGANSSVTGDNGVALGANASAGANGIAIGGPAVDAAGNIRLDAGGNVIGVTAGANQIVIGHAGQSAVIGGVDLAGIATNTMGIATNTTGITANTTGITANTTGITANTTGIATNATDIETNQAGIASNREDIQTNRSGIAMAVALANLPAVSEGDRGSWGVAVGAFDGESAIAAGLTFRVQKNSQIKLGISSSGGETSAGIGFGMGF